MGFFNRKNKYYKEGRKISSLLFVIAIIIGLLIVAYLNLGRIQLMLKGYDWSQATAILKLDDSDSLINQDKIEDVSTWLDVSDKGDLYDEYSKYAELYSDVESVEVVEVIDAIYDKQADLEELGYSEDDIWNMVAGGNTVADMESLIEGQYSAEDTASFREVDSFLGENYLDYVTAYEEYGDYNYAVNVVNYPFIISEKEDSSQPQYEIVNLEDVTILVKDHLNLPADYEPSDLVDMADTDMPVAEDTENTMLREEAANALLEMYQDALEEDLYLIVNSAYRSYDAQQEIYDQFEAKYGGLYASTYVADPGTSEHQTGLGVDLTAQSVVDGERLVFGDTDEYDWVVEHAAEYGFIIRYDSDRSDITGIAQEPWHLRYVGDIAEDVVASGLTYEEYCLYNNIIPELKEVE